MNRKLVGSSFLFLAMVWVVLSFGIKAEAADQVHTVTADETVESIAAKYNMKAEQLRKTNGLPEGPLFEGQKLQIVKSDYTPTKYQWAERGKQIAHYAKTFVGFDKTSGEESPETGFDSSGLVYWALTQHNVAIDRLTVDGFYRQGMDTEEAKSGDIIFFLEKETGKVVTAGIYIGKDQFVNAGYGADTVQIRSTTEKYFMKYDVAYKTYTPRGEHIVREGETLQSISDNYSISMKTIKGRNALPTNNLIPGQYLQIYSDLLFPYYSAEEIAYDKAYDVIKYAYTFRGFPYLFGGEDPVTGIDCSGLIYWIMNQQGIPVKRVSAANYYAAMNVTTDPKIGDLVFFSNTGVREGVTHVGIYLGDGRFLHTTEKPGVHISDLESSYFAGKFESFGSIEMLMK